MMRWIRVSVASSTLEEGQRVGFCICMEDLGVEKERENERGEVQDVIVGLYLPARCFIKYENRTGPQECLGQTQELLLPVRQIESFDISV